MLQTNNDMFQLHDKTIQYLRLSTCGTLPRSKYIIEMTWLLIDQMQYSVHAITRSHFALHAKWVGINKTSIFFWKDKICYCV